MIFIIIESITPPAVSLDGFSLADTDAGASSKPG